MDPAALAASVVLRLQTTVSREVSATESAVVTVGSLHVGTVHNVIADHAILAVNIRTFDRQVRQKVLAAIERIVHGDAATAGSPKSPEITRLGSFAVTANDDVVTAELTEAFRAHFGADHTAEAPLVTGSEDFGEFGIARAASDVANRRGNPGRRRAGETRRPGRRMNSKSGSMVHGGGVVHTPANGPDPRDGAPVLITEAEPSYDEQFAARKRKYMLMMGMRLPCLVLAGVFYHTWWLALAFVAISVPLPWIAVLVANDRPPRKAEEVSRYQREAKLIENGDHPVIEG